MIGRSGLKAGARIETGGANQCCFALAVAPVSKPERGLKRNSPLSWWTKHKVAPVSKPERGLKPARTGKHRAGLRRSGLKAGARIETCYSREGERSIDVAPVSKPERGLKRFALAGFNVRAWSLRSQSRSAD